MYPDNGCFKTVQYNGKQSANLLYQAWICRYTIPTIIIYDSSNEFLGRALKTILLKNKNINPKCVIT